MSRMFAQCAEWAGQLPGQPGLPPGLRPVPRPATRFAKLIPSILAGAAMLGSLLLGQPAKAQSVFTPGDTVVTGFSGIKPPEGAPPQGANPLDYFFIDPAGASMKIFKIGEPGEPSAQLLNAPADFKVPASDIGQVFAITLDDAIGGGAPSEGEAPAATETPPSIYLGASSVYGLNIVVPGQDGQPQRVQQGAAGAIWMDGQFGTAKSGGPGSIWRVDGTTGEVTLFSNIPDNSGPGIGDVVFDRGSRQFFASDLDSGLIHRIGADGSVIDSFDHGTMARPLSGQPPLPDDGKVADIATAAFDSEKPETWGFTQRQRMVWGMAVHGGRLYYAVQAGPEIWSVGIEADGSFGKDARLEIAVEGLSGDTYISDMLFDAKGRIYLAQRGEFRGSYDYSVLAEPKTSDVLRYGWDQQTGLWHKIAESYAIGFPEGFKNASGGIAIGQCNTRLWTTGDNLRNNPSHMEQLAAGGALEVHGLQGNDIELVRPQNEPPFKTLFVDYDGQFGDPEKAGHVGDVETWQSCKGGQSAGGYGEYYVPPFGELPPGWVPPSGGGFDLRLTKHARPRECHRHHGDWVCRFVIRVRNLGPSPYFGPIQVHDALPGLPAGSNVSFAFQPPWNCVGGPGDFMCSYPPVFLLPGKGVDLFVTVRVPLRTRECRVHNRAAIHWLPGMGDANPANDADDATAHIPSEHCDDTPERTDLKLEKRAFGRCVRTAGGFRCPYQIVVTNVGPGTYKGEIHVVDTVPAGTTANFAGLGWMCQGPAPAYTCKHGWVSLAKDETRSLPVIVNVPLDVARQMQCRIRNFAKITVAPSPSPRNTDPNNDEDGATANIPADVCDQPERTNLKLEKRAQGNCELGDKGVLCRYNIIVTNTGPGTYNHVLRVEDTIPAGASASFPAEWGCNQAGSSFSCGKHVNMPFPSQVVIRVEVSLDPATARRLQCQVLNRAKIVLAPGGTPSNTNPGDDNDQAVAHVPQVCDTVPVPLIEQPHCPPGYLWNGRNCHRPEKPECPPYTHGKWPRCIPDEQCPPRMHMSHGHCCPHGSEWNGRRCDKPDTQDCPPGTHGKHPRCIPDEQCPPRMHMSQGHCCPHGAEWNGRRCDKPDTQDCPPGTHGKHPRCVPNETPQCPGRLHMSNGHCCPPGKEWNGRSCERPTPECPRGTHGKYPRCIPDGNPQCPGRLHMSHGHCCPPGKEWNGQRCTRGGSSSGGDDVRVCPPGMIGKYPHCRRVTHCPEGTTGVYPRCHKVTKPCPAGTVGKPPHCRQIVKSCPAGTTRRGGACVPAHVVKKPRIDRMMQMERQRARQMRGPVRGHRPFVR